MAEENGIPITTGVSESGFNQVHGIRLTTVKPSNCF